MMGKIVGIALVGLTQFMLWIVLTLIIVGIVQVMFMSGDSSTIEMMGTQSAMMGQVNDGGSQMDAMMMISETLGSVNFMVMTLSFIFYFLGGYLLYASLFAAIGGAVDNDADTQQFMLPVSIPLILAVAMSGVIINQPDSSLAFWMSMIPFTSPITMMMRIPFGVPLWEILLSMGLLVAGFIFSTWVAGKIYKTGILMYGKKISYGVIWKWLSTR